MSHENVAILQALTPRRDTDVLQLVRDDVAWIAFADRSAQFVDPEMVIRIGVGMGEATRTYIGRDGFREAMVDWFGPWEEYHVEILETIDCGERVLRLTEHTGRMRGSASKATLQAA